MIATSESSDKEKPSFFHLSISLMILAGLPNDRTTLSPKDLSPQLRLTTTHRLRSPQDNSPPPACRNLRNRYRSSIFSSITRTDGEGVEKLGKLGPIMAFFPILIGQTSSMVMFRAGIALSPADIDTIVVQSQRRAIFPPWIQTNPFYSWRSPSAWCQQVTPGASASSLLDPWDKPVSNHLSSSVFIISLRSSIQKPTKFIF